MCNTLAVSYKLSTGCKDLLSMYLQGWGIWAVPLFVLTYVLVAVLGLPITIHTLTGGVVFGLIWGTVWSALAATLGAMGAFSLTRYLFQDWAITTFSKHKLLAKMNQSFSHNPFNLGLTLRFAPIAPFNLINFLLALTPINLKVYTFATLIGVIPGTIAYTWLGTSGKNAFQEGDFLQLIFASTFLIFLSISPLWLNNWRR
ncbi:TVP38/TMEM64 family protein [Pseudanabaena biceps]|nr:TVP38/TMEM64 family protein [Pseudanabaena biceps]